MFETLSRAMTQALRVNNHLKRHRKKIADLIEINSEILPDNQQKQILLKELAELHEGISKVIEEME